MDAPHLDAPRPDATPARPDAAPDFGGDAGGGAGGGRRTARKRRRWLILAGLLLLAGAGFYAYRAGTAARPADAYTTAAVATGDVEESVLATGILKPVRFVAVGAQASGRLIRMNVKLGQVVKAGDLIAEIDSLTQQNSLRTAEADLANIRAQREEKLVTLKYAELTLARQTRMLSQTITSQADFETAASTVGTTKAQIASLEAQIAEAEVAVENARVNLGYTRITAPIDGTILSLVTQEGQTVNASQSAPTIVILGAVDTMVVRTEISETDVVKVKPGQDVYFTILGEPDRPYHAKLESIEPAPESVKSDSSFSTSTTSSSSSSSSSSTSTSSAIYYNGLFNVPNPEGKLRTYMTAEVHIVLGSAKGVLIIPAAALGAPAGNGAYPVQVVKSDGTLETRAVTVGLNDKASAQVLSGLAGGEQVVTGRRSAQGTATTQRPGGGPPPGM
ncbi:efflux RND transporter periplasmic adaptor subunit [Azorhizobium doebereinerae]|uniref:efflux RND transporter periplasmic adaptor subunit n=1 Tax=Azorhizobium doebereinerae TaxID=281091 RepID=UPI00040B2471